MHHFTDSETARSTWQRKAQHLSTFAVLSHIVSRTNESKPEWRSDLLFGFVAHAEIVHPPDIPSLDARGRGKESQGRISHRGIASSEADPLGDCCRHNALHRDVHSFRESIRTCVTLCARQNFVGKTRERLSLEKEVYVLIGVELVFVKHKSRETPPPLKA